LIVSLANPPGRLSGDPFFVTHVIHIDSGIALKFAQAFNGAEIERFRLIVMTGGGVSDVDFHFADWINGHGMPPTPHRFGKCGQGFSKERFAFWQLAIGTWQLAQLKPALAFWAESRAAVKSCHRRKSLAANQRE
jgi:hypothetical protein